MEEWFQVTQMIVKNEIQGNITLPVPNINDFCLLIFYQRTLKEKKKHIYLITNQTHKQPLICNNAYDISDSKATIG